MSKEFETNLAQLATKKIYFGHQSVGQNIIDGLTKLSSETGGPGLKILSLHDNPSLGDAYFAHSFVGRNTDARSKCDDFAATIEKNFEKGPDIAVLKFCFVDIRREHDANAVFELYRSSIDTLQKKYPEVTFVHMTVPVTSHNVGVYLTLRRMLKKILGRRDYSPIDNIRRMQYNELLRDHYKDQPIFDIAGIESTYANGEREIYSENGFNFESLIFEYSDDGAHLNAKGSRLVASKLVEFLTSII